MPRVLYREKIQSYIKRRLRGTMLRFCLMLITTNALHKVIVSVRGDQMLDFMQ